MTGSVRGALSNERPYRDRAFHGGAACRGDGARRCPPYGVFALNIVGSEQFIQ
jgi:hypothetical protein